MSIPKLKKFLKGTKNFMIIMSIDLGEVRTGLAACDKSETLAYPLGTITEKNKNNLAAKILEKAKRNKSRDDSNRIAQKHGRKPWQKR